MEEITKRILKTIEILRTKHEMLVADIRPFDFETLRVYIEGHIDGLDTVLDVNLMRKITWWFQARVNQKASIFWTLHIKYLHKNKTDEERKAILLDTFESYFQENPDWHNKEVDS